MNHKPTPAQRLSSEAELSRRYHGLLADLDRMQNDLEADPAPLTVAKLNYRLNSIKAQRAAMRRQYEREMAALRA